MSLRGTPFLRHSLVNELHSVSHCKLVHNPLRRIDEIYLPRIILKRKVQIHSLLAAAMHPHRLHVQSGPIKKQEIYSDSIKSNRLCCVIVTMSSNSDF